MKKKDDIELLDEIYQNAHMGMESIDALLPKVDNNNKLYNELKTQRDRYLNYCGQAEDMLKGYQKSPKDVGAMEKFSVKTGIAMNTIIQHDTPHMARMVIEGNTMGIVKMTGHLKRHLHCDSNIVKLGRDVVKCQQQNIEEMKRYL
ncbi:hypothetical protein [Candidatus Soleaferrea massiliensis]|uniref:hypothetical protein n=1 Tax=Candidatus Soleaferrea massiliensis TaxID=1470354 RepID=UPI00059016C6|nr:hypothetical protein [Candidatus Soleaferrea massiliensis]